jgi:hypothetical protein
LVVAISVAFSGAFSWAQEVAILRNGYSIDHERRETLGAITRLYLSGSAGYIEIPTDQIERFETEVDPPQLPKIPDSREPAPAQQQSAAPPPGPEPLASRTGAPLDRQTLNLVVNGASERHQIDPDFINSVIRAESGFNNRAVSKKGAEGLMQLMPRTASELGVSNAFDANANVEGGTKYLRELLEKYNYDVPKALAAYNAGPKRVDQYRGVPPYSETRAYVARIIRDYNRRKLAENPSLASQRKSAARNSSHSAKTAAKTHSRNTDANSFPRTAESASHSTSSPVN